MEVFLASVVVSTLISSVFTYFQNRKSTNLQYITDERRKWREEIRNIYEGISDSHSYSVVAPHLTKLKTRINPYSEFCENYGNGDSHIWEVIRKTEQGDEDFEKNKKILLDYLLLLLKHDWERSKEEIEGNFIKTRTSYCYMALIPIYWLVILVLWKQSFGGAPLLIFIFMLYTSSLVALLYCRKIAVIHKDSRKKIKQKSRIVFFVYFLILVALLLLLGQGVKFVDLICGIIVICVLVGMTLSLEIMRYHTEDDCRFRYNEAVSNATRRYRN